MTSVPLSLRAVLAALSLLLLCAFALVRDLPMVDLPQHAAQIATWIHWDDPSYHTERLELNLRTPYLLGYVLVRALAPLVGLSLALKLVVWLAVVGYLLAFTHLLTRLGHTPWLGLLGLPTAFSYSYYFGFFSFLVAAPLALLCVSASLTHAKRPTWPSGLSLGLLLCVTLAAHGIAFFAGACGGLPLLWRGGKTLARRLGPALAPLLFGVPWLLPGSSMQRMGADVFDITPLRLLQLPAHLVGVSPGDWFSDVCGVLVLGLALASLGPVARAPERWMLMATSLGAYLLFPAQLRGYGFIWPRFALFVLPGLFLAFQPRPAPTPTQTRWRGGALSGLVAFWLVVFLQRLSAFNQEARPYHVLAAQLEPGLDLRALVFDRNSKAFPDVPLFLHLPALYLATGGGKLAHCFAMYPNSVVRYRAGVRSPVAGGSEWAPQTFDPVAEAAHYDYVVVRSPEDPTEFLAVAPVVTTLTAREGEWWAYRITPRVARLGADLLE